MDLQDLSSHVAYPCLATFISSISNFYRRRVIADDVDIGLLGIWGLSDWTGMSVQMRAYSPSDIAQELDWNRQKANGALYVRDRPSLKTS